MTPASDARRLMLADVSPPQDNPASINACPGEAVAHTRIRAMMLAEHHGLFAMYIGPVDAATTDPSQLRYMYLPAGKSLADLKRGEEPPTLLADEVLPYCHALAAAAGWGYLFLYRDGLPG